MKPDACTCFVPHNKIIINENNFITGVFGIQYVFDIVITSFQTEIEYCWNINPKINYQLITLPNKFPNSKTFSGSGLLGSDRASFGLSVLMLPDDLK